MLLLRSVLSVLEIRDGWKLYRIVAGGVMVRILLISNYLLVIS
jgi:hypothetical protein